MNALREISVRTFTYSDKDYLLTAGATTYQYDADGFLTTKTQGTEITSYEYSSRGELLSVTLPDNIRVEYVHDPLGIIFMNSPGKLSYLDAMIKVYKG